MEKAIKIVHLSDLHGKEFGRKNARLVAKIVKEKRGENFEPCFFIAFEGKFIKIFVVRLLYYKSAFFQ